MPKGYWIARVDVRDPERYKDYVSGAAPAFARFKGKFLVRGGLMHSLEGNSRARNVVIEFASVEDALACYHSPEYQAAREHRVAVSDAELVIVEGYSGPQPGAS
ncbi:uncharacterized protein (DUF1330 family) [Rhodopseudomonas julia]|uniref:Uncharacterized protein (DUF1330 family) n=1 Tax=Rhodopseudomonas julia TaxID=200617 RepID=A0ABU0C4G9_9BRAD|nr:DUF1330 domain-containing protein [Rhodopseudomonas julia]MDQ0325408.1 uncharacterized protein (DUF1330 family) [Rhodopseudomonas julia]